MSRLTALERPRLPCGGVLFVGAGAHASRWRIRTAHAPRVDRMPHEWAFFKLFTEYHRCSPVTQFSKTPFQPLKR